MYTRCNCNGDGGIDAPYDGMKVEVLCTIFFFFQYVNGGIALVEYKQGYAGAVRALSSAYTKGCTYSDSQSSQARTMSTNIIQ